MEVTFDNIQELLDSGRKPKEVFDYFCDSHEGFSLVALNDKYNFMDKNHKLLSSQWFEDHDGVFNGGFACVNLNGNWIFIDKDGKYYDENKKPLNESVNTEKEAKETIFDNKVFKGLLDYLTNATPEQLEEDWKQIEQLNKYGPLMGDLIKEALEKNKEQDAIKFPGMYPFGPHNPCDPLPLIHIVPDGYGGFKIDPGHYEVTTTSTSSLNPKKTKE